MTENRKLKRRNPVRTILLSILLCAGLFFAGAVLFRQYENGILEINSEQQDGYVKLVVDQIRLQENDSSAEIITNILSTLDASNSRYWTFADDGSIVFVKNKEETNLYQSVSTQRYFAQQGNADFTESLRKDKVIHQQITLDGDRYIASGTLFRYNNRNYQLILLTSVNSILENNVFMEAKTELYAVLIFILLLLFTVITAETLHYNRLYDEMEKEEKDNVRLRNIVLKQTETETERKALNPAENIFPFRYLNHALEEVADNNAFPVWLFVYVYPDHEKRNACLSDINKWITPKDILFDDPDQKHLAMLSMKTDTQTQTRLENLKKRYPGSDVLVYRSKEEMREEKL